MSNNQEIKYRIVVNGKSFWAVKMPDGSYMASQIDALEIVIGSLISIEEIEFRVIQCYDIVSGFTRFYV